MVTILLHSPTPTLGGVEPPRTRLHTGTKPKTHQCLPRPIRERLSVSRGVELTRCFRAYRFLFIFYFCKLLFLKSPRTGIPWGGCDCRHLSLRRTETTWYSRDRSVFLETDLCARSRASLLHTLEKQDRDAQLQKPRFDLGSRPKIPIKAGGWVPAQCATLTRVRVKVETGHVFPGRRRTWQARGGQASGGGRAHAVAVHCQAGQQRRWGAVDGPLGPEISAIHPPRECRDQPPHPARRPASVGLKSSASM